MMEGASHTPAAKERSWQKTASAGERSSQPDRALPFITPAEVATRLRVTPEQVRCLIRQWRLEAINVGTGPKRPLYRITQQDFEDFLFARTKPK